MGKRFKVGDLVRVREWDNMVAEFGLSSSGYTISCTFGFTRDMRSLCGEEFVIERIRDGEVYGLSGDVNPYEYSISTDMIEHVAYEPYDTSDIDNYLSSLTT